MSTNINLLLRTDEESLRQKKRIKILNLIAIIFLISVGVISLGIFISIQIINLGSLRNNQEKALKNISQFQSRQIKLFVLNNRIDNIDKILKSRKDLVNTIGKLLTKIPYQLSVDDFEVDDKSVIIAGQSKSLLVIGEFINNLTDMVYNKEVIKSLTLNSLTLDKSKNTYLISIKSSL